MNKSLYIFLILALSCAISCVHDGQRTIHIYTTGDIHGHYFDSTYVGGGVQESLLAVSRFIKDRRAEYGAENVILLDDGDILQGDNAAYYYNYVKTASPHIYTQMSSYMGYDAAVVGNHDIETGPEVYNRMKKELKMPFLAANALDPGTGKCHFREYAIIRRGGVKIAVIGCTNPNMRAWLGEDKLCGMDFMDPMKDGWGQNLVDKVREKEKPDAVIFMIHAGSGKGDGSGGESCGLDLQNSLRGVDLVVSAHDHAPLVSDRSEGDFMNGGAHCKNLGHAALTLEYAGGKLISKYMSVETVAIDKNAIDTQMAEKFHPQYLEVKKFSMKKIGSLGMELRTKEAFAGMNDYLNFVHTACLEATNADICFAAPLRFDAYVKPGDVMYNDLFTIYPYENQLFVMSMTGKEILAYLEASYDRWINTVDVSAANKVLNGSATDVHLLKIQPEADPRTGLQSWSFVNRTYNFDSASGIDYSVDITKPRGERIIIHSMADGSEFVPDATYRITTTSYRCFGGGGLMAEAGIADTDSRITERMPEIRDIIYDFFLKKGNVTSQDVGYPSLIGSWKFTPEDLAETLLFRDMKLIFEE